MARETATVLFTWKTTGFARGNYTITAVADATPGETNTTDDTCYVGWTIVANPGDCNADSMVDIFDIASVALAFASTPNDPNRNPNSDINNDGLVDIFDLVIVAIHLGDVG